MMKDDLDAVRMPQDAKCGDSGAAKPTGDWKDIGISSGPTCAVCDRQTSGLLTVVPVCMEHVSPDAFDRALADAREQLNLASDRRDEALDRALSLEIDNAELLARVKATTEVLQQLHDWATLDREGQRFPWIAARTKTALGGLLAAGS